MDLEECILVREFLALIVFFCVEVKLQDEDGCDCVHDSVFFLPRGTVSSPMTSVFKSFLTESVLVGCKTNTKNASHAS